MNFEDDSFPEMDGPIVGVGMKDEIYQIPQHVSFIQIALHEWVNGNGMSWHNNDVQNRLKSFQEEHPGQQIVNHLNEIGKIRLKKFFDTVGQPVEQSLKELDVAQAVS